MPPEKLTGTGSSTEWATFEERDEVFETMKEKASKLIDPDDFISIGTNNELIEKYTAYNFNNPDAELSSLIKNVIWGLFNDEQARTNLFPKWIKTEEDLKGFTDNQKAHLDPVGRSFIEFVCLAIRSNFIASKKRIEEHIASQLANFLDQTFDNWQNILKEPISSLSQKDVKLRVRLLGVVKNSEQLHSEIFSKYTEMGSMNVYGYFLRTHMGVEQAGGTVKKIMIEVIDKQFNDQRKNLLELIDKTRQESQRKIREERNRAKKDTEEVLEKPTPKKEAAAISSVPGKVSTIGGGEVPVPEMITGPQEDDGGDYYEDEDSDNVTFVNPKHIPDPPKSKIQRTASPTEYCERTNEVTDPGAPLPDTRVEPQPIEAWAEDEEDTRVQNSEDMMVFEPELEPEPEPEEEPEPAENDIEEETHNVIPPVPGIALKTPVPKKAQETKTTPEIPSKKPEVLPFELQSKISEQAKVKKEKVEDITVPDLPAIQAELGEPEKAILAEEDSAKREKKLKSWVAENPGKVKTVILMLALTVVGGAGYLTYKYGRGKSGSPESKPQVALKNSIDDQKERVVMRKPSPMQMAQPMSEPGKVPSTMRPSMKAQQRPVVKPKVTPVQKTADVRGAAAKPDDIELAYIDTKTIDDLPNGTYREMWEGKYFDVQDAPFKSISGFMEQRLKEALKNLPLKNRYKSAVAYQKELKQLEKGWLIYMSMLEKELQAKSIKGTITAQEDAQLKNWEEYKNSHYKRRIQARWLTKKYERLIKSKKKGYAYYKALYERGEELMEGLAELNPQLDDPNHVPEGKKVRFADGKKVLKTFWRFAHVMNLPMPEKGMSSTGSIEQIPQDVKFAENKVKSVTPPPIPEDAKVHKVDDSQIESVVPMYGAAEGPELKPVLGDMLAKKPPRILKDEDMFDVKTDIELKPILADMDRKRRQTPPPIPVDAKPSVYDVPRGENAYVPAYAAYKAESQATPPPIPVDAKSSVYDIPRGDGADTPPEYASIEDNRMPKTGPPPVPAMADIEKKSEKKGLWNRAKNWFKRKTA